MSVGKMKAAGSFSDEMVRDSVASWKANNQEERTLLLGSGHEPKKYDHVLCGSMPASGRFEAHILGASRAHRIHPMISLDQHHDPVSLLCSHAAPLFKPTLAPPAFAIRRGIVAVGRSVHCLRFEKGLGRNAVQ